jgi:cyclopropane-fatty-acyl-phospholipid synthase
MLDTRVQIQDPYSQTTISFLQDFLDDLRPRDFAIRLWDSAILEQEPGQERRFTLKLNHPGALRKMFLPPNELALGEAYIYGDFDVEGDLQHAFTIANQIMNSWTFLDYLRCGYQLWRLPNGNIENWRGEAHLLGAEHSVERDRQAIQYHYDVSNDFYKLWLDRNMVYSCAYFTSPDEALNMAQERKLDYLCRKLRLKEGERLLDIGCGWGGLLIHAAKYYGVEAVGITLSQQQAQLARQRIHEEGLEDRVHVEICDYREMDETQPFDKLVSVGMFEHVGKEKLPTYFAKAFRLLKSGGVFMNHGISTVHDDKEGNSPFIQKYVFPDGQLIHISETILAAEINGFEVRDVESLREHYSLTLQNWVANLVSKREQALKHVDNVTYRVWKLYMSAVRYNFDAGFHNLYQALFYKPDDTIITKLPLTRADWYEKGA